MTHHNLVLELQLPLYFSFSQKGDENLQFHSLPAHSAGLKIAVKGAWRATEEKRERGGGRGGQGGEGGAPNISTCTPTVEEMESDKERGRRRPFLKLITAAETLQNTQGQSTHFYFRSWKKRELFRIISSSADSLFMHREPRKALIPSKKSHRLVFPPSFI